MPQPLTRIDPQTGLEWQSESPGPMIWFESQNYVGSLSLNGRRDWRLPAAVELESQLGRKTPFDRMRPRLIPSGTSRICILDRVDVHAG